MSPQDISLLFTRRPSASTAVLLTLLLCRGYSQDGPQQRIVALLGDDVVLPCFIKTPRDASDMQLEWTRTDLEPGIIYVWGQNKENVELKQPSYVGRTSLSSDRLKHGDVSLTLSKAQLSDEGPYRCFVPQLGQRSHVDLVVGSVSAPVLKVISNHSSRVVLQCESAGWYPEPELLWLDSEGNLLPAGPSETLRGPDDLYTVSSRVTVEKKHGNITCRVQQKNINQSRETHIHVPGSVMKQRSATLIIVIVCLLYVCAFIALVWNCAPNICPKKPDPEKNEGEELKTKEQKHSRAPDDNTDKELQEEPLSEELENQPPDSDTSEEFKEDEKKEETETHTAAPAASTSCES